MRVTLTYLFSILAFVTTAQVSKQLATKENFYLYGGKNLDEIRSVKELPGKQYILAGTSSSFGQGNTSAYLIKTDSLGNHLWSYPYGGSQNDWAFSVEVTSDSGYFVAGFSNSFNPMNGYDAWYLKADKNGVQQWQKTISGEDWDFIYGSAPMPDGGYMLCGETYTNSYGSADGYVVRLNKNGDTLWTRHFGGNKDEKLNSVCVIGKYIYAVGANFSSSTDSAANGWVLKLDTNGNFVSEKLLVGQYHQGDEFKGVTPYDAGSFMICGKSELVDSNATQSLVGRLDTALNYMYGPYAGGATSPGEYVCFNQVINKSYGNICVVGTATGGFGGKNLFIVGFTGDLSFISDFAHNCGQQYDEYGYAGIYTSSGRLIFAGSAQLLCSSNPGLGLEDAFLVRFDSDSITNAGITQKQTVCFADTLFYWEVSLQQHDKAFYAALFPNPASDRIRLAISSDTQASLPGFVYSVLGTEVLRFTAAANGTTELDISGLDNGTYLLKLGHDGRSAAMLRFIVNR